MSISVSANNPIQNLPSTSLPTHGFKSLAAQMAALAGEFLGDIVYWTLSDADVSRLALLKAWVDNGFDPKMLPEEQTPEKALRLAVRAVATGVGGHRVGTLIRPTKDSTQSLVYAVVRETPDANGNYVTSQLALISLDRTSPGPLALTTDNPGNDTAGLVLKEYQRYLQTHTSRDVMLMLTKVLKSLQAVSLRETGGIYWVPRTNHEAVKRLQTAVEQIGRSTVFLLPVMAGEDANRSVGLAAAGSIEQEITDLRQEIDGFLADTEGVRTKTLARRIESFDELRGRAELYRSILGVTVADLETQLGQMTQQIEGMIAVKELEKMAK